MTNYEVLKIKTALTTLKDSGNISENAYAEMIECDQLKRKPLGDIAGMEPGSHSGENCSAGASCSQRQNE